MPDIPPHDDFVPAARVARFEQVLRKWLKEGWTPERSSYPLPYWGTNDTFRALFSAALESIERDTGFRGEIPSWDSFGSRIHFRKVH